MKYLMFFIPLILIMSSNFSYSKSSPPVKHSHNGRVHTHSLPNNGRGTHQHGKAQKRKASIPHSHNGRKHSHILPGSGINHNHSGQKSNPSKPSAPSETNADIKTDEINADGKTSTTLIQENEINSDSKTTEITTDIKDNETSADSKTTLAQEQVHFSNFIKDTGLAKIVSRKDSESLSDAAESATSPYRYDWYPEDFDNMSGINGPGELRFRIYPDGRENGSSAIKLESNFSNGKLVSNGKLTISELTTSYSSVRNEVNISPDSNIKKLIMENLAILGKAESD